MKLGKYTKIYAVVTQGIFSIIILLGLGYFIGYKIDKDSMWPGILAVVGAILGLISFIVLVLRIGADDKDG